MGALLSTRQREGLEENDSGANHAYRYPPKSGNYFGSHFIMGGERFDTPQPESYLFGENSDLNFLGSHPTPFPYPPPSPNEPTKTLRCLVNIRKESLRFVRAASTDFSKMDKTLSRDIELGTNTCFNIEFIFDSDVRCAITIHYFCVEEVTPSGVTYTPRDPLLSSETFHYKKGSGQQFCQPQHVFNPAKYPEDELLFDFDREIIPIVIHCVAEEGPEEIKQSHTTIATVEKITDGTYLLKGLKQKLFVDGLCYLLQEIYGIENKNGDKVGLDEETEDNGSECVICMCDVRDTLILPCRHLCLCNSCADSLRYQANNCPICRAPFRALLQIRALQKCSNPSLAPLSPPDGVCDNIPPGYEAVSLIEALNGPCLPRQPPSAMPDLVETPESDHVIAAHILNRQCDSPPSKRGSNPDSPVYSKTMLMTPRIENINLKEPQKCPLLKDGKEVLIKGRYKSKDSVKLVNEKEKEEILDEDSDGEKLSPLLQKGDRSNNLALHMAEVITHIDNDQDMEEIGEIPEQPVGKSGKYERGDESDYYTPDEPAPQVLYDSNANTSSVESTPQRLPGTPMSHASVKSSGDSYTSGSSTKHLLAVVGTSASDLGTDI